jgi:hypothetical protein
MSHAIRQPRILLALVGCLAVMCLGLIGPRSAEASWSNFCNPVALGGYGQCTGSFRAFHQLYGWGDHHSVCVGIAYHSSTFRCSAGPGAGVYTDKFPYGTYQPRIINNAGGTNTVHGISFTP